MLQKVIASTAGAEARLQSIPNCWLDERYFGMSAEQIYPLLPAGQKPAGAGPDSQISNSQIADSGGQTVGTFVPPKTPAAGAPQDPKSNPQDPKSAEGDTLETEWKQAVAQAATVARMQGRGHLPGAIEQLIKDLFEPVVSWQDLLRQFASQVTRDDYTFTRPNRRYAHTGIILPSLRTESLGEIVVAVDTSGSIYGCGDLLKSFLSELQGILDQCHPTRITLIDCDAAVHAVTEYTPGDDLCSHRFRGGGGTRFEPVFEHVEREGLEPAALLYFTDMYGSFPDAAPGYPVLWLNYEDPKIQAPFGQTIHVSNK
jgi:predicted metal-dependent peptidase